MRFNNIKAPLLLAMTILLVGFWSLSFAQEGEFPLRPPSSEEQLNNQEANIPTPVEVKEVPAFPNNLFKKSTTHRISVNSTTIPIDTRLRLAVDSSLNAKTSQVGDYFKAHILEDFYIPSEPPQLVIPKGSWVRGRISFIKRPNIFSMAGKIGLHLDELTTPIGEVSLIDAELDLQQGIVNEQGLLDPMTNYKTKAIQPTQKLLESEYGKVISIVTLGTPVIGSLVSGSLIALFSQGDNINIHKGQELQIVLTKTISLTTN